MTCGGSGKIESPVTYSDGTLSREVELRDCPGCDECQKRYCPDCGYDLSFFYNPEELPSDMGFGEGWDGYGRYWTDPQYPEEGSIKCDCQPCPDCGGIGKTTYDKAFPHDKFNPDGTLHDVTIDCPTCKGTGRKP